MGNNYPRKENFSKYDHSFNYYWFKEFEEGSLRYFDTEKT